MTWSSRPPSNSVSTGIYICLYYKDGRYVFVTHTLHNVPASREKKESFCKRRFKNFPHYYYVDALTWAALQTSGTRSPPRLWSTTILTSTGAHWCWDDHRRDEPPLCETSRPRWEELGHFIFLNPVWQVKWLFWNHFKTLVCNCASNDLVWMNLLNLCFPSSLLVVLFPPPLWTSEECKCMKKFIPSSPDVCRVSLEIAHIINDAHETPSACLRCIPK